jgi:hypothetical protein
MSDAPRSKTVPPARTAYFKLAGRFRRRIFTWAGVAVMLAAVWVAARYLLAGPALFQNGALSAAHQSVTGGTNCAACHGPWSQWSVTPARCLNCHFDEPHPSAPRSTAGAARTKLRAALAAVEACQACHREHQGAAADITRAADVKCQRCHQIDGPDRGHPEFALVADSERAAALRAASGLEFSHATHLKRAVGSVLDARNAERPLGCGDCHPLTSAGVHFEPIDFDAHCAACHLLRGPVHKTLTALNWTELEKQFGEGAAKLVLKDAAWKAEADRLAKWKEEAEDRLDDDKNLDDAARAELQTRIDQIDPLLDARRDLGAKECLTCHELLVLTAAEGSSVQVRATRYRQHWFTAARFSHRPHLSVACTDCHTPAPSPAGERQTVMLPGLNACVQCHRRDNTARADCVTCHDYHERLQRFER